MTTPKAGENAQKLNLVIEQGATLDVTVTWKDSNGNPKDLTGYGARMQLRDPDTNALITELKDTNGATQPHINLSGSTGQVQLVIPASVTDTFTFSSAKYDLELFKGTSPEYVVRLLQGVAILKPQVTV